ncbi:PH domain-containing protein [Hamadaea sp. NPDC050747]|uniref:PH domain-containing protein n=1 Tax=Hamadaea sp. NPDC050747 TaxID=3155789 RepID=UPI0033EADBA0
MRSIWQNIWMPLFLMSFVGLFCVLLLDSQEGTPSAGGWALALAVGVPGVVAAIRLTRVGVFATSRGLLVRGVLRTRTFAWPQIAGVTSAQMRSLRGQYYYFPALIYHPAYRVSSTIEHEMYAGGTRLAGIWLFANSPAGAEQWAVRIRELVAAHAAE